MGRWEGMARVLEGTLPGRAAYGIPISVQSLWKSRRVQRLHIRTAQHNEALGADSPVSSLIRSCVSQLLKCTVGLLRVETCEMDFQFVVSMLVTVCETS